MSAAKDIWLDDNDRYAEDLSAGRIDRDMYVAIMRGRGFTRYEAEEMADLVQDGGGLP